MSNALLNPSLLLCTAMLWNFCQRPNLTSAMSHGGKSGGGGEEVSILFRLMTKKGFRHSGVNYCQTTVRRTLQIFSFTLFTSLSDYRMVVRSVSLSNGQLSTSVIIRLVLLMFTGIVIK